MSHKRSTRTSQGAASSSTVSSPHEHMLHLSALNPYITCSLCHGYLIEATTVNDCLHTFCKSCLLKHFEHSTDCPKCHFMIHQSHPSHYVAFDRTLQDIVYKLVPGMQVEETRRRDEFQKKKHKSDRPVENGVHSAAPQHSGENDVTNKDNGVDHLEDPNAVVEIKIQSLSIVARMLHVKLPYVRISGLTTVNTIKRLLAYLIFSDITRYNEFDIFCNNELMGRDFSMAFIQKPDGGTSSTTHSSFTTRTC
uniref:RING-type domain-containing protein n=1 Tax=Ditylenchus dipsaci TaxID=166011 RepID=A0A915EFY3_9BILA